MLNIEVDACIKLQSEDFVKNDSKMLNNIRCEGFDGKFYHLT